MSIASEITRIQNAKASIKTSIENKGVTVGDGTLETYASKIDAIETGITPTGTINITENGTYDVSDKASANVNVDADVSEYFGTSIMNGNNSSSGLNKSIKKVPNNLVISGTNASYMFSGCSSLTTIPQIDTSKVTNMQNMFSDCTSLTTVPQIDTSKVTNMQSLFQYCTSLTTVPMLNTSKLTSIIAMFSNCKALTEIPQIDTSNATTLSTLFYNCTSLTTIPMLNASKLNNMFSVFNGCSALSNFGGLENLGQAYNTTQSANSNSYNLDLLPCSKLTHDSLMNVINNLYDIATKGCNTQSLKLGSTNMAKLTSEEIAIATNKGWTVS